jgi:hypothetical protein
MRDPDQVYDELPPETKAKFTREMWKKAAGAFAELSDAKKNQIKIQYII